MTRKKNGFCSYRESSWKMKCLITMWLVLFYLEKWNSQPLKPIYKLDVRSGHCLSIKWRSFFFGVASPLNQVNGLFFRLLNSHTNRFYDRKKVNNFLWHVLEFLNVRHLFMNVCGVQESKVILRRRRTYHIEGEIQLYAFLFICLCACILCAIFCLFICWNRNISPILILNVCAPYRTARWMSFHSSAEWSSNVHSELLVVLGPLCALFFISLAEHIIHVHLFSMYLLLCICFQTICEWCVLAKLSYSTAIKRA